MSLNFLRHRKRWFYILSDLQQPKSIQLQNNQEFKLPIGILFDNTLMEMG
jgi:hypothetical protein